MKRRASTNLDAFFERTLVSPKTCPAQVVSSSASSLNLADPARAILRVAALRLPAGCAIFPPFRPAFFPREAALTELASLPSPGSLSLPRYGCGSASRKGSTTSCAA